MEGIGEGKGKEKVKGNKKGMGREGWGREVDRQGGKEMYREGEKQGMGRGRSGGKGENYGK